MCGITADGRIELHVPDARQHLWSPQLIVDLHAMDGHTCLRARFGPHPHVWTLYVAIGAATVFGCLVGLSFAAAQHTMDQSPTALWSLPAGALLLAALYLVSVAGRRLGASQMAELRSFVEATLADASNADPSHS